MGNDRGRTLRKNLRLQIEDSRQGRKPASRFEEGNRTMTKKAKVLFLKARLPKKLTLAREVLRQMEIAAEPEVLVRKLARRAKVSMNWATRALGGDPRAKAVRVRIGKVVEWAEVLELWKLPGVETHALVVITLTRLNSQETEARLGSSKLAEILESRRAPGTQKSRVQR